MAEKTKPAPIQVSEIISVPVQQTITITVPVLDNESTDALTAQLAKLGYDQIHIENVTRITATRPAP